MVGMPLLPAVVSLRLLGIGCLIEPFYSLRSGQIERLWLVTTLDRDCVFLYICHDRLLLTNKEGDTSHSK